MIQDWQKDLEAEKSLRDVFAKSKTLLASKFNKHFMWWAVAISAILTAIWICAGDWRTPINFVDTLAEIGFDLTVQILGFLIGGFAIFATVSDHKLMIMLAKSPYRGEISVFKAIFFNFLSVFYIYVVSLGVSIAARLILKLDIQVPVSRFGDYTVGIVTLANSTLAAILFLMVCLCVLRLKSFIWNIYQAFVVFLQTSDIKQQLDDEAGG